MRGSGDFAPVLQCERGRLACSCQPALLSGADSPVTSGVPHGPRLLCKPASLGPVARVSRLSIHPSGSLRSGCCPLPLDSRVASQVWPPGLLLPWVWTAVLSLTPRSWLRAGCSSHLEWCRGPPQPRSCWRLSCPPSPCPEPRPLKRKNQVRLQLLVGAGRVMAPRPI